MIRPISIAKILFLLCIACVPFKTQAQSSQNIFEQAAKAYEQKNYVEAIKQYESLTSAGYVNPELLYNLGNAHFREGHIGQAIRFYHKALRQSPDNAQIQHSLSIAEKRIREPIPQIPEQIWTSAWNKILYQLGANGLFILGWLLYIIIIALIGHQIWTKTASDWRRRALMLLVPFATLLLIAGFLASNENSDTASKMAVVVATQTDLRLQANNVSKSLRVLPEGTIVTFLTPKSQADWQQVRIPNGDTGWLKRTTLADI